MSNAKQVITRKALAQELGVSVSRIAHYVKRGMPTVEGGLDHDQALAWIERNIIPQGGRNAGKGAARVRRLRGQQVKPVATRELLDPPQERARRDRAATYKIELENRLREGQLMITDEARAAWARTTSLIKTQFLGVPAKVSPRLVGRSAPEIQALLMREMREVLGALAQAEIRRLDPGEAA